MKKKQYISPAMGFVMMKAKVTLLNGSDVKDKNANPDYEVLGRDCDFSDEEE